eukprot:INCI10047.2.p1 GENE.INCI10047.2~~INCI10047.2.p1  ORF type:complete len:435 (-),score=81.87 INCI10047.2:67-1269(-)
MGTALSRQKYESVSMSRKATGGDDSDEMDVSCGQRTILLVYDTFELSWDCCNIYRRCTDPDWHHHEIFLREKSALRQLGAELRRKLRDSFNFAEMTLEEDLRNCAPVPSHDVAVLLQHDWPTVNENPGWLLQFTNFVQMTPIVPNYTEMFDLYNKTTYLRKLLAANAAQREASSPGHVGAGRTAGPDEIPLLPTIIVGPDTDVLNLARRVMQSFRGDQFVVKENFSAGKEGVSFMKMDRVADPDGARLARDLEAHRFMMQARSNANQIIAPEFVVQEFEPEFETAAEIRMFYIEGEFVYAVDHVGWIGPGSWPTPQQDPRILEPLQRSVRLIMRVLPSLQHLYLVRFDFGPNGRLNEIEIFPDMFGGPMCSLKTQEWELFRDRLSDALVRSIHRRLSRSV